MELREVPIPPPLSTTTNPLIRSPIRPSLMAVEWVALTAVAWVVLKALDALMVLAFAAPMVLALAAVQLMLLGLSRRSVLAFGEVWAIVPLVPEQEMAFRRL